MTDVVEYSSGEVGIIGEKEAIPLLAPRDLMLGDGIQKKRIIVLAGPTCCGKSKLAIQLAKAIDGEVVSADSMQVYRGLDIGTAKVSKEERLLVPHHLIDIRDLCEPFNVVDFYHEAYRACEHILSRGNVPIIAGGTGFYMHALLYGPPAGPPSIPSLRKELERELEERGAEVLHHRLTTLDPVYAATVTVRDQQKIVRALEIMTLTGNPVTELGWHSREKLSHYDFHCWFLHRPRESLYERIDRRCDKMLKKGFLEEVEECLSQGLKENRSAAQAIGYRQAIDFLSGNRSVEEYDQFVTLFKRATRHYAKRQFTWFRKEPLFRWLDVELHDPEVVFDIIKSDFESL